MEDQTNVVSGVPNPFLDPHLLQRYFEVYLRLFFGHFDIWCLNQYANSGQRHQDIAFRESNWVYDQNTQIYTRDLEIQGVNSPRIVAIKMWFNFDFVGINNLRENVIDEQFVHEKVFEALKDKMQKAKFQHKIQSGGRIDDEQWSEWTFYNISDGATMTENLEDTYHRIFLPIQPPLYTLIDIYSHIHLVLPADIHLVLPAELENYMPLLLWNAIGRITEMAEHVINKKLESQN